MSRQSKNDESGGVTVLKPNSHQSSTNNTDYNNWYQINSDYQTDKVPLTTKGFLAESMRQDGFINDFDIHSINETNEELLQCDHDESDGIQALNSNYSCNNRSMNKHSYNCPCCGLDLNVALNAYHAHVTQCYTTRVLTYRKLDEALEEEESQKGKKCVGDSKSSRNSYIELRSSSFSSSNHADGNMKAKNSVHSTASTTVSEPATVTLEQLKCRVAQLGTEQRIELMKAFRQLSKGAQEER